MKYVAIIGLLFVAACTHYDGGGYVFKYVDDAFQIERRGGYKEIRGVCLSACTYYLRLPPENVCVAKGTRLGFHLSNMPKYQEQLNGLYPRWVRKWIDDNGGLTYHFKYMPAEYAAKYTGWCDD